MVRYISEVAPSPHVFIQTARWHSTRAEILRNPPSHHGVVCRCGARTVLFVVSRIAIAHFRSEKIQDQVSQKVTPKEWLFDRGTIGSFKVAVYLTGRQARVDLAFLMGRQKTGGSPSLFTVHENRTKRASLKLNVSKTKMWKILQKRLRCKM